MLSNIPAYDVIYELTAVKCSKEKKSNPVEKYSDHGQATQPDH